MWQLPRQALLIRQPWVDKIFDEGKDWEIRSFPTQKRGTYAVAPTAGRVLVGEVTIMDCIPVGVKADGKWTPVDGMDGNFIFNEKNQQKCGFSQTMCPEFLMTKKRLYAWVLGKVVRYETPIKWVKKPGAMVFCNIEDPNKEIDKTKSKVQGKVHNLYLKKPKGRTQGSICLDG